jgi:hypothetical protein
MEEERNYEEEAVAQGWNPDFDGPKKVDAKTFVEKGDKIAGILKSRLDKQDAQIKGLQDSNQKFGEYHKKTLETQTRQTAEKVAGLEAELAQAVTDGDGQRYTKTKNEIKSLEQDAVPNGSDGEAEWARLSHEWGTENRWYSENPKLRRYADGLADEVRYEGYDGKAYFSELTRRVKADFPDDFTNPNKTRASGVEGDGQPATKTSKARSYDNLPPDAKAACSSFAKDGFMSVEDYVNAYEWED